MKRNVVMVVFMLGLCFSLHAQDADVDSVKTKTEKKINELNAKKEDVRENEKNKLKAAVERINKKLAQGEITATEAQREKEEAAKKRAQNIENKLDLLELNISLIRRNRDRTDKIDDYINVGTLLTRKKIPIDSVPYLMSGSWGLEIGYGTLANKKGGKSFKGGLSLGVFVHLNQVLSRKDPHWRLDYGFDFEVFMFRLRNNKIVVDKDNKTILEKFPEHLRKTNFQVLNVIFPVHLEFGPAPVKYGKKKAYYDLNHWGVGVGGFLGFKSSSSLFYQYKKDGKFDNVTHQRSYNTNNFLYGLSAYAKYGDSKIFFRYYLNQMFKSAEFNGNVLSVGIAVGF